MDKPDAGDELATYEHEIDAVVAHQASGALSGDECSTACRALGSMRRATERICAIDVGAACEDARRRTATAESKVNEACPGCAAPVARAANEPAAGVAESEAVPPQHGGCAGCATSAHAPSSALAYAALVVGALAWRRRARARARVTSRKARGPSTGSDCRCRRPGA